MEYVIQTQNSEVKCNLTGELIFDDHINFRKMLGDAIKVGEGDVVFNLGGLEYVDSAGLGMFLVAKETIQEAKRNFYLEDARGQVGSMLELAKLQEVLRSR